MSLVKDLQESIQKNLPQQVAGELKKYIDELELTALQVESLLTMNTKNEKTIKDLNSKNSELQARVNKFNNLEVREKQLDEKEQKQEVAILKIKLDESEKRADVVVDLTRTVFKSPFYKKSISENRFIQQESMPNGQYASVDRGAHVEERYIEDDQQ